MAGYRWSKDTMMMTLIVGVIVGALTIGAEDMLNTGIIGSIAICVPFFICIYGILHLMDKAERDVSRARYIREHFWSDEEPEEYDWR